MRSLLVFSVALVLLGAVLPGTIACNKSSDQPKTSQTPTDDGSWSQAVLATLNEQPITMADVFRTAEIRQELINMRNQDIELRIIRYRFAKEGLTTDDSKYQAFLEQLYTQMNVQEEGGKSKAQVFEEKYLAARDISPESWKYFAETQHMAEELVAKLQPVTDADLQAEFESMPPQGWLQQFGQQFGWASEADVTIEPLKEMMTQKLLRERISELTAQWGKDARSEGALVINRLPSESLPEEAAAADGTPAPKQAPAMTSDWTPPAAAYVLGGEERTWEGIFSEGFLAENVERLFWTPIEQRVMELAWSESGLSISDAELGVELERVQKSMGGPEAFDSRLVQISTSADELNASIARFAKTKRLLAKEFPVTDAEVDQFFNELGPEQRTAMAQQELGLSAEEASNITLEQARPILREILEAEKGGQQREAWLAGQIQSLISSGKLVLKDPRLKAPEVPEAPPAAIDLGEVAPPAAGE